MTIRSRATASILPLLALALPLAACGKKDDGTPGTSITIAGKDDNVAAATDKDGVVSVNVPGVNIKVDLPKIDLTAGNFDIDGVKLYPGSRISSVDVKSGEGEKGGVAIAFDAPGDRAAVRDYFVKAFEDKGMQARIDGEAIAGIDEDGDPFRIALAQNGAGKTQGHITTYSRE